MLLNEGLLRGKISKYIELNYKAIILAVGYLFFKIGVTVYKTCKFSYFYNLHRKLNGQFKVNIFGRQHFSDFN